MAALEQKMTLLEVSRRTVSEDAGRPVQSLLDLFQSDPHLLSVAVLQDGVFLGSITRKALFALASRPFAIDLYAKRPIHTLLQDLGPDRVVMEPELEINSAAMRLLSLDPTLQTDAFPLVRSGSCVGVVAVADLMMAVAEDQRRLLQALDRLSSRIREEVARATRIQQELLPLPSFTFVKQHGGFISVVSEPGQGSVFSVYLPVARPQLVNGSAPQGNDPSPASPCGDETILLVEDNALVRELLREVLTAKGYRVVEAIDGADGLEKFQAHTGEIDLVVMDVVMPRKSGREAFRGMRAIDREVRTIFMSGYASDAADRKVIFSEGDGFLLKPIEPPRLLTLVREVLDRKSPARAA